MPRRALLRGLLVALFLFSTLAPARAAVWTERTCSGESQWNGIASSSDGAKLAAVIRANSVDRADGNIWTLDRSCAKDHRVLNGACVACDPGTSRAPGDVPWIGDTECLTCCEESFAKRGFAVGREFALRSGRELR